LCHASNRLCLSHIMMNKIKYVLLKRITLKTKYIVHFVIKSLEKSKWNNRRCKLLCLWEFILCHRHKAMYFFFQVLFKSFFFNYLAGVISLWLMAVPFILPTPLFRANSSLHKWKTNYKKNLTSKIYKWLKEFPEQDII
jgi:hypothetical protein